MENKINKNLWNLKKNDEYYTPKYVVESIIPFLKDQKIKDVWCPADTEKSEFVKVLKEEGFKVINSHVETQESLGYGDFLKFKKEQLETKIDLLLTNPPFSLKAQFIDKANELDIPYIFLLGNQVLNYKNIAEHFQKDNASILFLVGRRISFNGKPSSFQCAFYTNLVKGKIIYIDLNNWNKKK